MVASQRDVPILCGYDCIRGVNMSDSNRVGVSYIEEVTWGVTPSGNLQKMRITNESLKAAVASSASQELRSDRQVPDFVRTGKSADGDVAFEFTFGQPFDDMIEAALMSDGTGYPAEVGEGADVANVTFQNGASTITRAAGSFITDGYLANQWIRIEDANTPANNGYYKIATGGVAALILTVLQAPTDDASATSTRIQQGGMISNGVKERSYSIEKDFDDLSTIFEALTGMEVDQWALSFASDTFVTGSFTFIGKTVTSESSTIGTGYVAANTNSVMNAINNVSGVMEGTTYGDYDITGFTMTLQNNLRARLQVGTEGAISIGSGTLNVAGTVQAYFNTVAVMDKLLNDTTSSLALMFEDAEGNAYLLDFPSTKYSTGQRVAPGINQDVIADMGWTAFRNATEDATITVTRFITTP